MITQYIEKIFESIDYNLLFIFIALFVVSGCFVSTGIPYFIWKKIAGSSKESFASINSTIFICIYTIIASQLIGNVALVIMAKDEVRELPIDRQKFGWIILGKKI